MMGEERPEGKEAGRLSRLGKTRKRRRRKRAIAAVSVLAVVAFLLAGALLDIPHVDFLRSLLEKIRGGSGGGGVQVRHDFLRLPRSGRVIEGDADVLVALRSGEEISALLLFTLNPAEGRKEVLLLPERVHTYNSEGAEVPLSRALSEREGRDLLRATAERISGSSVEYLVVYELEGLLRLLDSLSLPPVRSERDLEVIDPRGGAQRISSGQAVRDSDRVLFYLLAGDADDPLVAREERSRAYLGGLLYALEGLGRERLEELLAAHPPEGFHPDPAEELPAYLASMVEAACDPVYGELAVRSTPRVEVLNGCGTPQLGGRVAEALRRKGIRVSGSAGNAKVTVDGVEYNDFSHDKSLIRYGKEERRCSAYAQYLGVLLDVTEVVFDPSAGGEVVLVAGRDAAAGKFGP